MDERDARNSQVPETGPATEGDNDGLDERDACEGGTATGDDCAPRDVDEVVDALTAVYERLDAAPREDGTVGWGAQLAALRAFREGPVAGDRDVLARLLVDPHAVTRTDDVRFVLVPDEADEAAAVREIVGEALAAGERALVLAPTALQAAAVLRGVADDGVFALAVGTEPGEAPPEPPRKPPERPKPPQGTVEFKRVPDVTRVQALPVPAAPETWVRAAVLRTAGEAWRQSWETELRMLRRGLMWLEQWPRDHAALEAARAAEPAAARGVRGGAGVAGRGDRGGAGRGEAAAGAGRR
ncbi:hypothetical protein, partial [Actinomadura sp. CNU-125]|uniref:hypothetical protein n=1 Tax=Actinomadura sp. CNU-125 TaxID=1904961 RepID=UPI0021CCD490